MADASVAVTAGTGTAIDTRTVAGEHRQVMVVGDHTNSDVATVKGASTAALSADPSLVVTMHPDSFGLILPTAHDAVDAGHPVKMGFRAVASLSGETMVSSGDRVNGNADVDGAQIVRPYSSLADIVDGRATSTVATDIALIAAQAAGVRTYLTSVSIHNSSTTDVSVTLRDGTTNRYTIPAPKGGGAVLEFPVPLRGSAATAWNFTVSTAVSQITVSAVGFKSKV